MPAHDPSFTTKLFHWFKILKMQLMCKAIVTLFSYQIVTDELFTQNQKVTRSLHFIICLLPNK